MSELPLDPTESVAISPVELELPELVPGSGAPLEVTVPEASVVEAELLLVDAVEELPLVVASDVDPPDAPPPSSPQAAESTKRRQRQARRDRDIAGVYVR